MAKQLTMAKSVLLLIWFVGYTGLNQALAQPLFSLGQLCRMADKTTEEILNARDDIHLSRQQSREALSGLIPHLKAFGRYHNDKNEDYISPDSTTLGITLGQTYTLNGREFIAWEMSQKRVAGTVFSKDSIRANCLFQVAQSYFQILKSLRRVEIAQADVERLRAHKRFVQEQLKAGDVTKTALLRAKAELSKSLTDRVVAENEVLRNKADMTKLTGVERRFDITETGIGRLSYFSATLDSIMERAMENRSEIKHRQKALEIATRNIDYETGLWWPALTLETGYKKTHFAYDMPGFSQSYNDENTYIQADLLFTLYDGGHRRSRRQAARLEARQAGRNLAAQKKQVAYEAETAFLELVTAKETLKNLEDELLSAQENFSAVRLQFKFGMTNSIEIMDANTLLVQAQRRMADARYTLYLAALKILYTQGDLTRYLLALG